ncbi:LysM peptidoglycan-binding domain-containing protein [Rhodococcus artemisiae]|uniref:LysM peptidoglycan-binding domain-containing protein n=1 Tax=Rhodococcus artemisiae TaxID=714159 RepID=A0ABU7LIW4_9NOCA|nr:LysM peptidoglycan-binding domain-containing protein [Rhodococcus artemisiae]MEE2060837.1 LysM peptidoglycan-binding domain-containing protein [Rhodococcus artemisiae]
MSSLNAGQSLGVGQELKSDNGKYTLTLQQDGNLVLSEAGKAVWAAGTNGSGAVRANVQEDGNFVLYKADNSPVWASETSGSSGVRLTVQDDRNVVLYAGSKPVWASNSVAPKAETSSKPAPAAPAPTADPAPAADPDPAPRVHTVASGDTLWAIAERFYGDGNQYRRIADASGIPDPDLIRPGQVLTIP